MITNYGCSTKRDTPQKVDTTLGGNFVPLCRARWFKPSIAHT